MFKWFTKRQTNNDEDKQKVISPCVLQYYIAEDGLRVDIAIDDFNDKSIASLAYIINCLDGASILKETVQIIKYFFEEDGHGEDMKKLYALLSDSVVQHLLDQKQDNSPCIKPSDMI